MLTTRILLPFVLAILACRSASAARFDTDITGHVIAIEGTVIVIKDAQDKVFRGETARSALDPQGKRHTYRSDCMIEVTGQELIKNLQPGLVLQLECRLANRRAIVGEIKKLSLIVPHAGTQSGVLTAEAVVGEAGKVEDCLVVGQLIKNRNGNLTITYAGEKGNIDLTIRRPPEEMVDVIGGSLNAIRAGDKIRAQGYTHGLPHFFAREVEVEHVPLVEAKDRLPQANKKEVARNEKMKQRPEEVDQNAKVKLQIIKVN